MSHSSAGGGGLRAVSKIEKVVGRVLSEGRAVILLAVILAFLTSCGLLVYAWFAGLAEAADIARNLELGPAEVKQVSYEVISLVDLLLLGTVLYVVAVGLYQLFIDAQLPVPPWLSIVDLDDLKERLLSTVVVLLAVSFLGYVVTWDGTFSLVGIGGAIGFVLIALALLRGRFKNGPRV